MIERLKQTPLNKKSTNQEIKNRFDNDVERFSNLDTGQQSMIDADIMMDLITRIAIKHNPDAEKILDISCGTGNNTLKVLGLKNTLNCDLVDLSMPMLKKAEERITNQTSGKVRIFHEDIRTVELAQNNYDIIIGAAVFHHLREENDWIETFKKVYNLTAKNGIFLITDVIAQEISAINNFVWEIQAKHLENIGGSEYVKDVFTYIDKEDSPRPVTFQMDILRKTGFKYVDIIHKNACSAAIAAVK